MIDASPQPDLPRSALYVGRVTHRRLRPRPHSLGYRVFNLLLDLDDIGRLSKVLRLFSRNRFNLISFHERDHGDGSDTPLRAQVERMAASAGVAVHGGSIQILCMPRVFGYVFNPISVYFCRDPGGHLACIVYEVNNTFGQRHSYVIPVASPRDAEVVRQTCAKAFYVSPFLDMDLTYDFEIRPPGDHVGIAVVARDASGPMLATAFSGARRPLSDAVLARAVLAYPFLTLKVVAGIHWEAVAIWMKGIRPRSRPPAPAERFTPVGVDVD